MDKEQIHRGCSGDTEYANESELRRVLEERNLYAVSTFTPSYQATWWSGRAQHHGRHTDYVAVSDEWRDLSAKPAKPACDSTAWRIDRPCASQSINVVATGVSPTVRSKALA